MEIQVRYLVLKHANALKSTIKLRPNYEGPYRILVVLKRVAHELTNKERRMLPRPWSVNHLKKLYTQE